MSRIRSTLIFLMFLGHSFCFASEPLNLEGLQKVECYIMPLNIPRGLPKGKHFQFEEFTEGVFSVPNVAVETGVSLNWSGFVAVPNKNPHHSVVEIKGIWTVPALIGPPSDSFVALFTGIDGYTSSTLEQIGTLHTWQDGFQQDIAWFQLFPNSPFEIVGFCMEPGDLIESEVRYIGNDTFKLTIVNLTTGSYTVVPTHLTKNPDAERSSAEWIVEAPSSLSPPIVPLANFGTAVFSSCSAVIHGVGDIIGSKHWQNVPLNMVSYIANPKAGVSALQNEGSAFGVEWLSSGP